MKGKMKNKEILKEIENDFFNYNELKNKKEQLEKLYREKELDIINKITKNGLEDKFMYQFASFSIVKPESVVIDEDKLKAYLVKKGIPLEKVYTSITSEYLDEDKLKKAVDEKIITAKRLAKYSTVEKRKIYIRVSRGQQKGLADDIKGKIGN